MNADISSDVELVGRDHSSTVGEDLGRVEWENVAEGDSVPPKTSTQCCLNVGPESQN